MFVAPSEPCAKCYALVFKNEFLRLSHIPYHITIVITNIQKQKHRTFGTKKETLPIPPSREGEIVLVKFKTNFFSGAVFLLSLISKHDVLRVLLVMPDGSLLTITQHQQQT